MAQEPLSLWPLAPPLLAVHSHLQTPSFLVGCGRRSQLCLQRERFFLADPTNASPERRSSALLLLYLAAAGYPALVADLACIVLV